MPELPEVEVLRRSLEPHLVGDRIERVEVTNPSLREPVDVARLRRAARGREVIALRRRSKYLLIDLEGGWTVVVHLGMSGRLTLAPAAMPPELHEHVAFHLRSRPAAAVPRPAAVRGGLRREDGGARRRPPLRPPGARAAGARLLGRGAGPRGRGAARAGQGLPDGRRGGGGGGQHLRLRDAPPRRGPPRPLGRPHLPAALGAGGRVGDGGAPAGDLARGGRPSTTSPTARGGAAISRSRSPSTTARGSPASPAAGRCGGSSRPAGARSTAPAARDDPRRIQSRPMEPLTGGRHPGFSVYLAV